MIKKSKKIMASLLLTLSLIAVFPVNNVFALTKEEESQQYYDFIHNECTQTTWNKSVYENDGKYYLLANPESGSWKPDGNFGWDIYADSNGMLLKNVWEKDVHGFWHYYGSDYNNLTGYQTIDGKKYYFNNKGIWQSGWEKRSENDDAKASWKDKHWYYYGEDGIIKEGWVNSGGKWYYIYSDGLMAYDTTTPDGYHVDKNGVWV